MTMTPAAALGVAKQRMHVGIVHAGHRSHRQHVARYDEDGLVAEVAHTTTKPIARFKVHKPNHHDRSAIPPQR